MNPFARVIVAALLVVSVTLSHARPAEAFVPLALPLVAAGKALWIGAGAALGAGSTLGLWAWLNARTGDVPAEAQWTPQPNDLQLLLEPEHLGLQEDGGAEGSYSFPYLHTGTGGFAEEDWISGLQVHKGSIGNRPHVAGTFASWSGTRTTVEVTLTGTALATGTVWAQPMYFSVIGYRALDDNPSVRYSCNVSVIQLDLVQGSPFSVPGLARCTASTELANLSEPWEHAYPANPGDNEFVYLREGSSNTATIVSRYNMEPQEYQPGMAWRITGAEVECYDPSTDSTFVVYLETDPYVSGYELPAILPQCPEGSTPRQLEVWSDPAPGSSGLRVPLIHWEQEDAYLDPQHDLIDCLVSPWLCVLRVERITDTGTEPCTVSAENCRDWFSDPQRAQKYVCMWGDHELPIAQCYELAQAYNPGTGGLVVPNPNLNPQPEPNPDTGTGIEVVPNDPEQLPGIGGTQATQPVESPGTADGCLAQGLVAWNPVTWVYAPVVCAMQAMFLPSEASLASLQTVPEAFHGKPPHSVITGVSEWWGGFSDVGTSCLLVEMPVAEYGTYTVIDSCTPGAVAGWIMDQRALLAVVIYGLFVGPLAWWAWKQYAPGSQGVA